MSSVALIGANGQLGTDLRHGLRSETVRLIPLTRHELDIRDRAQVARVLGDVRPDVIVNTAAFLNVDACEDEVDQAFAVNAIAIRGLALEAEKLGALLVHVSTDYVFDGQSQVPYTEESATGPVNVYGNSKLAGEFFVRSICSRHLVVRSSGLYGVAGSSGKGGNFVQTMLRRGKENGEVSVVTDQVLGPTYTADLAQMMWRLIAAQAHGLFHVTSSGECSWFDFAQAIFALSGLDVKVRPATTAAIGSRARRPAYSVLANRRLELEGHGAMRPWRAALDDYLKAASRAQSPSR